MTDALSKECSICLTGMNVLAFQRNASDLEESESTFRLECGHAFHSNCLCRALRMEGHNECPVCRSAGPMTTSLSRDVLDADFVINPDGSLSLVFNQHEEGPEDLDTNTNVLMQELRNANQLIEALDRVRRIPEIQSKRRRLNEVYRHYREFESHMIQNRHARIQDTLREFRLEWRLQFSKHTRSLKRLLQDVKDLEVSSIRQLYPTTHEDILGHLEMMADDYALHTYIGNHGAFSPLQRKFWYGNQ